MSLFLKGILMGISIAAPVGPIGILCIRRTLTAGQMTGFISGLGAATADAIYGCIAGLGLTFISSFLVHQQSLLRIIGGLFLCYLGLKIMREKFNPEAQTVTQTAGAFTSTFFLTLTNPMTILSFSAIFAGWGLVTSRHYFDSILLILGVFLGSASWWLCLTTGVCLFQNRFNMNHLKSINQISGIIILCFGSVALITGF